MTSSLDPKQCQASASSLDGGPAPYTSDWSPNDQIPPYSPFEPGHHHSGIPRAESIGSAQTTNYVVDAPKFPRLNIIVQVVGSRGDVQPFIALGVALQKCGHRVRIATHNTFEAFVRSSGLEFYPVGGDPEDLMAYMVSSPRLVPDLATLRAGAIARKRKMYQVMLEGFWEACLAPDSVTGCPFVADAIIANPPSYAHVHCAEALGIPCHLVFTMPWTSTGAFAQPLAGLSAHEPDGGGKKVSTLSRTNFMSYAAVNFLTWQGLGDIVNHWRIRTLDLEAVPATEGPHLIETYKVPFTYCWSPSLVPKPPDWGENIDVCGFFFREPPEYNAPPDLEKFLSSGPGPVYIGFGSIVVGDPAGLMAMVLSAVKSLGIRAIISRGWSNLAGEESEDVFFVGDCPHEWLFQRVAAVVHHGGAGTTACGLSQPFWGEVIHRAGAGPSPLPYRSITSQKLAQAIRFCLSSDAQEAAAAIACKMAAEDGINSAVDSFHRNLPRNRMFCDFFPEQTAVWAFKSGKKEIKMCREVPVVLRNHGQDLKHLRLLKTGDINIDYRRWDPITAVSAASLATIVGVADAAADIIRKPIEEYHRHNPRDVGKAMQSDGVVPAVPSGVAMLPLDNAGVLAKSKEDRTADYHERKSLDNQDQAKRSAAAAMISASAHGAGKVVVRTTRGVLVDIPLAATEGLRAVPQLWGEQVERHEHIEGFRSGVGVAGRSFKEGGAMGAVKGLSQGAVGLATKSSSAVVGLATYPAQGVSKSIRARARAETQRRITQARWREGEWLVESGKWKLDETSIVQDFQGLKGKRV
ncbi:hypothetical protein TruAng_003607 [Truncatella angustata]|nr:hypothetical protein TruAng_003607 [Truncatella angustata]